MAEHFPDVVGLYADDAKSTLELCGMRVVCISTAPKEDPSGRLRVIRQKQIALDLIELVLS